MREQAAESAEHLPLEVTKPLPWDTDFKRHFLQHYWQKQPLLIRQAYPPDWRSPVEADELAGFACAGNDSSGGGDCSVGGEGADEDTERGVGVVDTARDQEDGGSDGEEYGHDENDGDLLARVVVKVRPCYFCHNLWPCKPCASCLCTHLCARSMRAVPTCCG